MRVESGCDITSPEAVSKLASNLKGSTIDVLINNAGILKRNTLENLDFDSIRQQFEVNALGPLRVT
ncbi:short-chain dehydrogenases/reductases family protein, fragment [Limnospira platensis NIES-39]|uniref:Short-chain dehydrogenases/reductases family protein n=1 Tax=Limnospira platensis NIES-46 TaxID=1236695 RepID=A0A5M3T2J5_LIMPL|nr:short-chain dehydrogenases/reductases family protein, fragment [Arthrospira platensis NIES-39]BDT12974.1 short-chain dehydrogenases/reductases family protein, fragment [Arthrospira platensis NIES-39]GCE92802.1 short-chain dehydrogenases/reductases family protein, fragment [Arthrospira platensis NIES-46]